MRTIGLAGQEELRQTARRSAYKHRDQAMYQVTAGESQPKPNCKVHLSRAACTCCGGEPWGVGGRRHNSAVNETATAVLLAASGGIGAFAGAAITTALNYRTQDKTHRREQLRRDAETLGPVHEYLFATSPDRLAMNAPVSDQGTGELYDRLIERRDQHISAVQILSAGHPDAKVRSVARELPTALFNSLTSAGWVMRDRVYEGKRYDVANEDHQHALDLLRELDERTTAYGDK